MDDEFKMVEKLSKITGTKVPQPIMNLNTATVRFNNVCEKKDIKSVVLKNLGL